MLLRDSWCVQTEEISAVWFCWLVGWLVGFSGCLFVWVWLVGWFVPCARERARVGELYVFLGFFKRNLILPHQCIKISVRKKSSRSISLLTFFFGKEIVKRCFVGRGSYDRDIGAGSEYIGDAFGCVLHVCEDERRGTDNQLVVGRA